MFIDKAPVIVAGRGQYGPMKDGSNAGAVYPWVEVVDLQSGGVLRALIDESYTPNGELVAGVSGYARIELKVKDGGKLQARCHGFVREHVEAAAA